MNRWMRRLLIAFFTFALLGVAGVLLWRPVVQHWLEHRLKQKVISEAITRIQPEIPFKIEKLDFDASWKEVQNGQLRHVTLVLSHQGYEFSLTGPFDLQREAEAGLLDDDLFAVTWRPELRVKTPEEKLAPVALSLQTQISGKPWDRFAEPLALRVTAKTKDWEWKKLGLKIKALDLDTRWASIYADEDLAMEESEEAGYPENFSTRLKIGDIDFTDPAKKDRAVHLSTLEVNTGTHFELQPLTVGPLIKTEITAGAAELAEGDLYLEVPLAEYPLWVRTEIATPENLTGDFLKRIGVQVGPAKAPWITAEAKPRPADDAIRSLQRWALSAKSRSIALGPLSRFLAKVPATAFLESFDVKDGALSFSGEMQAEVPGGDSGPRLLSAKARSEISGLTARVPEESAALRGARITIDARTEPARKESLVQTRVHLPEVFFKKFHGKVPEFPIRISQRDRDWVIALPEGVPVQLEGLPLKIGPISGAVGPVDGAMGYRFVTSAKVELDELSPVTRGVCADPRIAPPPAKVRVDFPRIEVTTDSMEIDGGVQVDLFGGKIRAYDFALYDPFTEIPEFQFSADWDRLRLDELGKWSGIGKMDGVLYGYVKDVVSRAWLAPNYEFFWELKPLNESRIVFSGKAMENVLSIVGGADFKFVEVAVVDKIARWVVFGFPSDVFGGWNISEAGMRVRSRDGDMIVETTTSEAVVKEEGKHFIIYSDPVGFGPIKKSRVKVPLNTARYPLIMDASAFYRQVKNWGGAFARIAANAAAAASKKNAKGTADELTADDFDLDCQPPEF